MLRRCFPTDASATGAAHHGPHRRWWRFAAAAWWLAVWPLGAAALDDFLSPDAAFRLQARVIDARTVEVAYTIAPGYYLYRDRLQFEAADGAQIALPVTPAGHVKFDQTFQKEVETYRDRVAVPVAVRTAPSHFRLSVSSQGCADRGLCYPPQTTLVDVSLAGFGGDGSARVVYAVPDRPAASSDGLLSRLLGPRSDRIDASSSSAREPAASVTDVGSDPKAHGSPPSTVDETGRLGRLLQAGSLWTIVAAFFVAGVLLSLTPCVLPMLPILSSIIVGQSGGASRGKGFLLAGAYSFGMAVVYTLFGVAAGLAGEGLAAWLQNPWVLGAFAAGLAALGVSMLMDSVELRLPAALTARVSAASNRLPAGRFAGVFAMGGLSALIVSPCVAAPLAGALIYLSQTHDVVLGGTALFALAAGMSVPLLLLGASAGALLPKAGAWMDDVKRLFGLLLLGVAVWTVAPVLPGALTLASWGALLIVAAVLVHGNVAIGQRHGGLLRRSAAAIIGVCGALQLAGAASGGADPLQPLAHLRSAGAGTNGPGAALGRAIDGADVDGASPRFAVIHTTTELDAHLAAGRPVLLDFYADWCKSCKEMEATTYADPVVRRRMARAVLLKADVTANSAQERALLKRYGLFGPPGTLFFGADGRERVGSRVIGYQNTDLFLKSLDAGGL